MWTRENRGLYERKGLRYPSDLSDAEWALIAPLIPPAKRGGRRREVDVREVLNGVLYVLGTGCQWRALPKDLPPKSTVHDYLMLWDWDGTLERIHHALYLMTRDLEGREASPSAGVIDSQSVKGAEKGGRASTRRAMTRAKRSRARSAETVDHVRFLRDAVLKVNPDFVLLQWNQNDVEGHDKTDRPVPYRALPSDMMHNNLIRHSAFYYILNDSWIRLQVYLGILETYDDYMLTRFGDENSASSRRARMSLEEFVTLTRDHDIPLGIILFPRITARAGNEYKLGFLLDRVLALCTEHDVPCLDMRHTYLKVADKKSLWANRLDGHPGFLANKLAADAVLEKFGEIWQIDRRSGPR